MSHFQTRVKNFFAIRKNFFSRRPFGRGQLVGANALYAPFRPHRQAFFRKKLGPFVKADKFFNQPIIKTRKKSY